MTETWQQRRDRLAHEFTHECTKYSGYPAHLETYRAAYGQGRADLLEDVEKLLFALEYQLTAWRKVFDGSMFTPESERQAAEKIINEALINWHKKTGGEIETGTQRRI